VELLEGKGGDLATDLGGDREQASPTKSFTLKILMVSPFSRSKKNYQL